MSARMKSSSADPDFVRMSRFKAAMEASAALDQLGDDGRIGLDRRGALPPGGGRPGPLVRERRDEVAAVEEGLQRVPDQRIGSPHHRQETRCTAGRRSQASG